MQTFDFQKFLVQLPNIGDEEGFWRSHPIDIGGISATSGVTGNSGGLLQLLFNDSGEVARVGFIVPLDYDSASDAFKLAVSCRGFTTLTNTLEIDTVQRFAVGAADSESLTVPAGGASQVIASASQAIYTFDLSGMGLVPGDAVTIELGCTIDADSVKANGLEGRYRSTLVASDRDSR